MSETDKPGTTVREEPPAAAPQAVTAAVTAAQPVTPPPGPVPAPTAAISPVAPPPKPCLDCGAPLEGKYCIACGQRAQLRNLSLPSLAHEAIHDLAQFDSRGWMTLRALLLRPGFLTSEFIHGRRTRYLPPFRLYLVLSLLFFVVLSCKPGGDGVAIRTGPGGTSTVVSGSDPEALKEAIEDVGRELGAEAASDPKAKAAAEKAIAMSQALADPDAPMMQGAECKDMTWDAAGKAWIEPRLTSFCEHLKRVSKRQFGRELVRNIPKMMFLFLPLLALVNLLLYAFRRRKYVEHLLFYVHFHAFAFLLLTLQILLSIVFDWLGLAFASGLLSFAVMVYLFVALFKAMRVVYGQSRLMTSLKYLMVLIVYSVFSVLTLMGTVFYTAMTV